MFYDLKHLELENEFKEELQDISLWKGLFRIILLITIHVLFSCENECFLHMLDDPPEMEEYPSFSTSSLASVVTWVFHFSHSDWFEVESQGCFDLHFLIIRDDEHLFRCFSPLDIPQLKIICSALYSIFNTIIWFSGV